MVSDTASGRAALAGIALMTAGIFLFAVNDALGKWLVATYTVGQVLLIRSLAALALLAPFIWRDTRDVRRRRRAGACRRCGRCSRPWRWPASTGRWPICRSPT